MITRTSTDKDVATYSRANQILRVRLLDQQEQIVNLSNALSEPHILELVAGNWLESPEQAELEYQKYNGFSKGNF